MADVTVGFRVQHCSVSVQLATAPGTKLLGDPKWGMLLMQKYFVHCKGEGNSNIQPTVYFPNVHPARHVCFGQRVTCLIFPTGKIVAHGSCSEDIVRRHAAQAAELTSVCLNKMLPIPEPKLENLVVRCPRMTEVHASVDADMLWMDKTAARLGACPFPDSLDYVQREDGGEGSRVGVAEYCPEYHPGVLGIRVPSAQHGTAKPAAMAALYEDGNIVIHSVPSVLAATEAYLWILEKVVRGQGGQAAGAGLQYSAEALHRTGAAVPVAAPTPAEQTGAPAQAAKAKEGAMEEDGE